MKSRFRGKRYLLYHEEPVRDDNTYFLAERGYGTSSTAPLFSFGSTIFTNISIVLPRAEHIKYSLVVEFSFSSPSEANEEILFIFQASRSGSQL